MCNIKRGLLIALSLVLVVSIVTSFGVFAARDDDPFEMPDTSSAEVLTSRYTQYVEMAAIAGNRLNTEGFQKVLENDAFELWFKESIDSIRVLDKKSGYIWGELTSDMADLNDYWAAMANSIFTVEYYDAANNAQQISLSDERFEVTYEFDTDENVLSCFAECYDLGIDIGVDVILKDDRIDVQVQEDSLYEYDVNKISKLYLLPFFGCTPHKEMDGYLFVPDGSGALMRYDENVMYTGTFTAKVYGPDVAIDTVNQVTDLLAKRTNDYLTDEFRATVPVYGVVHGAEQYAAMTVISGARDYAVIQASLAGSTMPYNRAYCYFEYRQIYAQPVSKNNSVQQPQAEYNNISPKVSIYLLSGEDANYNGMALKYRDILEDNGTLEGTAKTFDKQIPLRVEVLGSDIKKGFIANGVRTFTTVEEAKGIQSDLSEMGIDNLTMVFSGWQKGGVNGHKYGSFATQGTVGSLSDLKALQASVEKAGGTFYLQDKVTTFTEAQGRISYLGTTSMSKKNAYYLRDNPSVMFNMTYVTAPETVVSNLQKASSVLDGFNLQLPRFGSELYSDHRQEYSIIRSKTRSMFTKTAKELNERDMQLAMNAPNMYMWNYVSDYMDIPMSNSQYVYETDSVPFLQILLRGHVNYYAPYANQGFYTSACVLKSIEYGAYPSFFVMAAENNDLNKTPMVDYFSLNFEDWKGTIETVYGKVNKALMEVEGATIVEHKALSTGVVRVTYDNGVKIYVNYNSDNREVDGVTVPGLDFTVGRV